MAGPNDTTNLGIEITANDAGATPVVNGVLDLMVKMKSQAAETGVAGRKSGEDIAAGAERAKVALSEAGVGGQKLGRDVHAGADEGMFALRQMHETALGLREALLTFAGPVTAIFAIGEAFKSGLQSAGEFQKGLMQVQASVRAQGGNVDEATAKIETMSTALARSSGIARGQFVEGVKLMLNYGLSLNSALASQAAAQNMAAATGKPLIETEQALAMAHNGNARELLRMGLVTREQIKTGFDYDAMLSRVSQRYAGQVAAANEGFIGQMKSMAVNSELVFEALGDKLLPMLTAFATGTVAALQVVQDFIAGAQSLSPALQDVRGALGAVWEGFKEVADSGPVIVGIMAAGTIAAGRFAVVLMVDAVLAIRTFAVGLAEGAVAAMVSFNAGILATIENVIGLSIIMTGRMMNAIRITALAFAIEGVGAIRTFAVTLLETAIPAMLSTIATFLAMNWPLLLVGAAVAAFAVVFATHLNEVKTIANDVVNFVINQFGRLTTAVGGAMESLAGLLAHVPKMGGLAKALEDGGKSAAKFGEGMQHVKGDTLGRAFDATKGFVGGLLNPKFSMPPQHPYQPGTEATGDQAPGRSGAKSAGQPFEPQLLQDYKVKVDEVKDAQKALTVELYNFTVGEDALKQSVLDATSAEGKARAEMELHARVAADAAKAYAALDKATDENTAKGKQLEAEQKSLQATVNKSGDSYNALAESLRGQTKVGSLAHAELTSLKKVFDDHKKSLDEVTRKLDENTANYNTNVSAMAKAAAATHDLTNAQNALILKYNDASQALLDATEEDQNTYGKSIDDQIAYWQRKISELDSSSALYLEHLAAKQAKENQLRIQARDKAHDSANADADAAAEMSIYGTLNTAANPFASLQAQRALAQAQADEAGRKGDTARQQTFNEKVKQLDNDLAKARIDAHDAFLKTWEDRESGWMEGLINHTKSLRDTLKEVWQSILNDYIHTLTQMAAQKIFGGLNGGLGGILGGGQGSGGLGGGIFSFLGGGGHGASPTLGAPAGATPVYIVGASASHYQATTGSPTGVSGVIGGPGGSSSSAGAAGAAAGLSYLQRQIAAGGQAMAVGGLVTSLTGGNAANGSIGSLAGSALGSMFGKMLGGAAGGPIGMLIGSALGGLVGGLFGPSQDPSKTPDIHDPLYAQMVTNLNGAQGSFNGQTISPDNKYNASMGGTSLAGVMANFVKSHASDQKDLTASQKALYTQILGLMGGNANAGESSLHVASEKEGTIHLASGTAISVAQLEQIYGNFQNQAGAINSNVPVWSVQRGMPDYNLSTGVRNGTFTPGAPGNGATGSGTTFPGQPVQPPVKVEASGAIFIGAAGIDELTKMVTASMARLNHGTVPGGGQTGLRFATQTSQ